MTIRAIDQLALEQGTVATTVVGGTVITANVLLFGGTGTVRGVVLDANGLPVAGAVVGGGLSLVQTDANGQFVLTDVPLGSRTITAVDQVHQLTGSTMVNLATPGEDVSVQIILEARGTLVGRIFEADGVTPVAGLTIFILGPRNDSVATDANGNYQFPNIPLGTYLVSAFRPDFSDGNVVQTKLVFKDEVRRSDVVFRGKGRVTGVVLDDDGVTPLGATVGFSELRVKMGALIPPDNLDCIDNYTVGDITVELPKCVTVGIGFEFVQLTRTVQNNITAGTFAFDDVFVGDFNVEAANAFSPDIIAASGKITTPGQTVHVTLQLVPTSVVKGTVFEPDGVTPVGQDVVVTFNSGTLHDVKVVTDPNGQFLYPLVTGGAFELIASDPVSGLVGQSRGTVEAGRTADVPIRLLGIGDVTVEVMGSNGIIAGAQVRLQRGTFPNEQRSGVTDSNGRLVFTGGDAVTEGPFSVTAFDPTSGVTGFASGALPGPNTQTTVQIVLPDESGVVQGRFVKTDGVTGIPNAQVRLSASHGEAYDTTAADGSFHFDGVPKGTFTLEAFDPVTARRGRSSGQIVANLEQVTMDIVEVPQGSVKGVVLFSNGRTPVAGADVSIAVSSVFGAQLRTTSGVDGTFRFPGVSAGSFSISAQDPLTSLSGGASGSLASEGEEVEVEIVITVPALGRVEGVVTRANASPAIGAQVSLAGRTTTVDNTGFYFFDSVPVGAVSLLATAAIGQDAGVGSGTVAFDGDVEHIDIHLTGTGTVTGTVRDGAGTPVAFAHIVLNSRSDIGRLYSIDTVSALDGSFQFGSIPVGDASVTAVQAVTQLAGSASGSIPTDGATIDLPVMLQPSGAVAGCVVRQDGATPAVGMALELIGNSQHFGSTGTGGCFQFTDLSLGTYALTVTDPLGSGIVRAMATLVAQGQVVNIGTLTLDEAAPQVVSVTPSDGQINVPVTQVIEVLFSEPVAPTSITPSTVQVTSAHGPVAGSLSLDTSGARARFSPSTAYRDFERISVKVTTGVEDLVGKPLAHEVVSSFVTADSTPPSTLSFSPASGARDVALNTVVRVVYSEAVDPTAFAGPPIAVALAGVQLNGRTDFLFNNTVVVFTPNVTLLPNSRYDVSLLPAADVFGNHQSQGRSYAFNTLDTIAPTVTALTAVGGPVVQQNTTVMMVAGIGFQNDVAFVEFLVGGQVVSTDTTAPYTLALPVTASGGSSIVVSARATDLSGNVGALTMLTLTVQPDAPPTVEIVSPGAGSAVDTGSSLAIAVHAGDDFGITRVGLQVNGSTGATFVDAVSPATLMHDSMFSVPVPASAAPGSLVLRAAAVDTAGQSTSSAPLTVMVNDATPPAVQITNPADGTLVDPGAAVTVQVAAQDNGQVSTIRLIAAGVVSLDQTHTITPAQSSATTSFQLSIPTTATGQDRVTLTAEAVDGNGNRTSSAATMLAVRDRVAPMVSLSVQGGLTRVPRGRSVTVSVAATDEVGVTNLGFQTTGMVAVSGSTGVSPPRTSTSVDFVIAVPVTASIGSTFDVVGTATDGAGNIGTSPPVSLTVASEVTATLSVMKQGNGTGTVTSSPAGIDCGNTCSQTFTSAVTLHLTASANPGSVFVGWGGDCSGATTSIDVAIAADTTCSATFALAGVMFDATADSLTRVKSQRRLELRCDPDARRSQLVRDRGSGRLCRALAPRTRNSRIARCPGGGPESDDSTDGLPPGTERRVQRHPLHRAGCRRLSDRSDLQCRRQHDHGCPRPGGREFGVCGSDQRCGLQHGVQRSGQPAGRRVRSTSPSAPAATASSPTPRSSMRRSLSRHRSLCWPTTSTPRMAVRGRSTTPAS